MNDVLSALRAHAAAHPTDVQTVRETLQMQAELDAYAALAKLAKRWRLRQYAARALDVPFTRNRTLRGFAPPVLDEEPFLLQRRITPRGAQEPARSPVL